MSKLTIRDVDVSGKRVLVRVDFNVPLNPSNNSIMDDSRMRATFPTIKYLVEHKAKTVLCSHLGRPDGKIVETLSMAPVAQRLSQLIALPVYTAADCVGQEVIDQVGTLRDGDILLLENLRFHIEEENNDDDFAKALSLLADIYVDDAFGTAHRAHASNVGITRYLPAYCGLLMEKELNSLGKIITNAEKPFAALLGGAKVSDKIGVITNILDKVDYLLFGGSMATNILSIQGFPVGLSKLEKDKAEVIRNLLKSCREKNIEVFSPLDVIVTRDLKGLGESEVIAVDKVPEDCYIVDMGPRTIELFKKQLDKCKTVFWNGPMGIYEVPRFSNGTQSMATAIANLNATTVVGGGSTAEIVEEMKLTDNMTHVSTGGGASLEFLEGKTLPGVSVLLER